MNTPGKVYTTLGKSGSCFGHDIFNITLFLVSPRQHLRSSNLNVISIFAFLFSSSSLSSNCQKVAPSTRLNRRRLASHTRSMMLVRKGVFVALNRLCSAATTCNPFLSKIRGSEGTQLRKELVTGEWTKVQNHTYPGSIPRPPNPTTSGDETHPLASWTTDLGLESRRC